MSVQKAGIGKKVLAVVVAGIWVGLCELRENAPRS